MYVGEVLEGFTCRDRDVDIEREGLACTLIEIDGLPEDFEEIGEWIENCKNAAADTDVVGVFNCQGEMADFILDAMLANDDPQIQKLAKGASTSKGQPDTSRIEQARAFTTDIMSRYA